MNIHETLKNIHKTVKEIEVIITTNKNKLLDKIQSELLAKINESRNKECKFVNSEKEDGYISGLNYSQLCISEVIKNNR